MKGIDKTDMLNIKFLIYKKILTHHSFLIVVALMLSIVVPLFVKSIELIETSSIDKKVLQKDITKVVKNDGDLRAIKQTLLNQPNVSYFKIALSPFSFKKDYYRSRVPLSTVLHDVRLEAYRNGDKSLIPKLEPIIREYEETNPFDKLQTDQRDHFENIRLKTGTKYNTISNDINKLADKLFQQNQLVDEYLSESKMSFWISVVALAFSLIIGGYQIFASRPEAMRRLFLEILGECKAENLQSSNKSINSDN